MTTNTPIKFCYYTRPLAGQSRFTGQPKYRGTRTSEESVAEIVTRSGVPIEQVEKVIRTMGQYVVEQSMDCWQLDPILGWFGYKATCGGSHASSNFTPTYEGLAIDIRTRMGEDASLLADNLFSPICTGHNGLALPQIIRVINRSNPQPNSYTPGKSIQIELKDGNGTLDPSVATQGVFFKSSTGVKTRSNDYGYSKGSLIICVVPTGLTGEQELSVCLNLYKAQRTGIFSIMLTPAPALDEIPSQISDRQANGSAQDMALPS